MKVADLASEKGRRKSQRLGQRMIELTEYKGLSFLKALEQAMTENASAGEKARRGPKDRSEA